MALVFEFRCDFCDIIFRKSEKIIPQGWRYVTLGIKPDPDNYSTNYYCCEKCFPEKSPEIQKKFMRKIISRLAGASE